MSEFLALIGVLVIRAIQIIVCGWCIESAIEYFQEKRYFWFGVEVAVVIFLAGSLLRV